MQNYSMKPNNIYL